MATRIVLGALAAWLAIIPSARGIGYRRGVPQGSPTYQYMVAALRTNVPSADEALEIVSI